MEFKIEDKFYTILQINIIPGILAISEILLFLVLKYPEYDYENIKKFVIYIIDKPYILTISILLLLVSAMVLGLIVDSIRHILYNDYKLKSDMIFINKDQLEIYKHYILDNWYSYETIGNIAITMVPGIILLPLFLYRFEDLSILNILASIFYTLITFLMVIFSRKTQKEIEKVEKSFYDKINL